VDRVLKYGVYANYTEQKVNNFVFSDNLAGQDNFKDLKIYEVDYTLNANPASYTPASYPGHYQKAGSPIPESEYTVSEVDNEGNFKIEFKNQVNKIYYVEYTVVPNPNLATYPSKDYTNTATISGQIPGTDTTLTKSSSKTLTIPYSEGGGQSSTLTGNITINKVDSLTKSPITSDNAEFDLYFANEEGKITDVTGTVNPDAAPVRTGETSGGAIEFSKLYRGYYLLVETSAPEGYGIADNLVGGLLIYLSNEEGDSSKEGTATLEYKGKAVVPEGAEGDAIEETKMFYSMTLENEKTVVNINKRGAVKLDTDVEGSLVDTEISNAQFKIENANGQAMTFDMKTLDGQSIAVYSKSETAQLISTINGSVKVLGLLPGEYVLKEVTADEGYLVNTAETEFEVNFNEDGTFIPVNIEKINYKGRAEIIKLDEIGGVLEGVTFDLVNVDTEEVIKENVQTDASGRIAFYGLKPGNYAWVEKEALDEYVLNSTPSTFTVSDSALDVPATSTAIMVNEWVKTEVNGMKIWDDQNDKDRIRPDDIKLILKADGKVVEDATPEWTKDQPNVWKYSYTGLDKYDIENDGQLITYTIDEEPVTGYTKTIDGFNITNKHTSEEVKGEVADPDDGSNGDGDGSNDGNVLGETADNGKDGTVLGEEANTSDGINMIALISMLILAALLTIFMVLRIIIRGRKA
jgi:uncharacterized surface anchored protein